MEFIENTYWHYVDGAPVIWEEVSANILLLTFNNSSESVITDWADDTTGVKQIQVEYDEQVVIPQIKYDTMSAAERNNDDYIFKYWYYINDNDEEVQFDANKALTQENFADVADLNLTIYAKVQRQWSGPY